MRQIEPAVLDGGADAIEGEGVGFEDVGAGLGVAAVDLDQLLRRLLDGQAAPGEVLRPVGRAGRDSRLLAARSRCRRRG